MLFANMKEKVVNLDNRLKVVIFLIIISLFTFFSFSSHVAILVVVVGTIALLSKRFFYAFKIIFSNAFNMIIGLTAILITLFLIMIATVYFFT